MRKLVSIGEAAASVIDDLPSLSAEQWRERDADIQITRDAEQRSRENDKADRQRHRLAKWGVPIKDLERVCLSSLRDTPAMQEVQKEDTGILILSGPVGCGKSTAAAWWISQAVKVSPYLVARDPLFIPVYKLQRVSWYGDEIGAIELAKRLVIDDLGTEFIDSKNAFISLFRGIVDARYANRLPLLITTNKTAVEFKDLYGERTIDRMREVGRFIELQGESLRV